MPRRSRKRKSAPPVQSEINEGNDSIYWPEHSNRQQEATQADDAVVFKRPSEIRLEMKAVKEGWPIPRGMRERLVCETFEISQNAQLRTRVRLASMELMRRMVRDNLDIGELPHQVEVEDPTAGQEPVDVQAILQELSRDPAIIDALDYRPVKDVEYAE